ncbi:MAG: BON domain-containing protein [Bdellovibrio sp.]
MEDTKKRNNLLGLLIAASVGAVAMYFLDPQRGHARRTLARDKIYSLSRKSTRRVSQIAQNLRNRLMGAIKDIQSHKQIVEADDETLVLRIRSSLGRKVSHAKAIKVSAQNGIVTLSGPILKNEVRQLMSCVENVPGVKTVKDELSKYDKSGDISSLQGKGAQYFQ